MRTHPPRASRTRRAGPRCEDQSQHGERMPASRRPYLSDESAVIRKLEIIGEAAARVSAGLRDAHPEIPWRAVIGMRNRLIHGYDEVRMDQVWAVLQSHLRPLIDGLRPLIPPDVPAGS